MFLVSIPPLYNVFIIGIPYSLTVSCICDMISSSWKKCRIPRAFYFTNHPSVEAFVWFDFCLLFRFLAVFFFLFFFSCLFFPGIFSPSCRPCQGPFFISCANGRGDTLHEDFYVLFDDRKERITVPFPAHMPLLPPHAFMKCSFMGYIKVGVPPQKSHVWYRKIPPCFRWCTTRTESPPCYAIPYIGSSDSYLVVTDLYKFLRAENIDTHSANGMIVWTSGGMFRNNRQDIKIFTQGAFKRV